MPMDADDNKAWADMEFDVDNSSGLRRQLLYGLFFYLIVNIIHD